MDNANNFPDSPKPAGGGQRPIYPLNPYAESNDSPLLGMEVGSPNSAAHRKNQIHGRKSSMTNFMLNNFRSRSKDKEQPVLQIGARQIP